MRFRGLSAGDLVTNIARLALVNGSVKDQFEGIEGKKDQKE